MDPMRDLPMGFGMALLQDPKATRAFYAMTPAQRQEIIQRTHAVSSKTEMRALVAGLSQSGGPDAPSPKIM